MGKTQIKPNGQPGHFEIEWSFASKVILAVLSTLLATAVIGIAGMHVRLAVIENYVDSLKKNGVVDRREFDRHNHHGTAAQEGDR